MQSKAMSVDQVREQVTDLENRISTARAKVWECDRALQPLGGRKRNKPPEVVAQIQVEIDRLRAEKQEAIALQNELQPQLTQLRQELAKLERVEGLNRQQAERDKLAATQNNGCGRSPNQGRDTTWRI